MKYIRCDCGAPLDHKVKKTVKCNVCGTEYYCFEGGYHNKKSK